MPTRAALAIALRALRRNRLQTSLTIIGMTIGVAAVLTMIAIGTGAEAAIEDQIRAAGMNLIVVTAGNYKVKSTDDFGGGAVEPSAALRPGEPMLRAATWDPRQKKGADPFFRVAFHPEDDPMEKHNHPTARQRLGDSEAGLGSAATLTAADADAIRGLRGVQYVAEGLHQNVHVKAGSTAPICSCRSSGARGRSAAGASSTPPNSRGPNRSSCWARWPRSGCSAMHAPSAAT